MPFRDVEDMSRKSRTLADVEFNVAFDNDSLLSTMSTLYPVTYEWKRDSCICRVNPMQKSLSFEVKNLRQFFFHHNKAPPVRKHKARYHRTVYCIPLITDFVNEYIGFTKSRCNTAVSINNCYKLFSQLVSYAVKIKVSSQTVKLK